MFEKRHVVRLTFTGMHTGFHTGTLCLHSICHNVSACVAMCAASAADVAVLFVQMRWRLRPLVAAALFWRCPCQSGTCSQAAVDPHCTQCSCIMHLH